MRKMYLGFGTLSVLVGILMLFVPETIKKLVIIILGFAAIGNGFFYLFSVRKLSSDSSFKRITMIKALTGIAVGIVAIILPITLADVVWRILMYTLAIYLIFSAMMEMYTTYKLRRAGFDLKPFYAEIIGSLVLALILFMIPIQFGTAIIRVCGFVLMITGILIVSLEWKNKGK